jgi:acyl-CoA oxidase
MVKHMGIDTGNVLWVQREMDVFVSECEAQLCVCLRADVLPSVTLCDAIAVAKAKAVEDSIYFVNRLSNEVGSYALMAGSGAPSTSTP